MMTAKKRAELCDELVKLAREVKEVPQKTWEGFPEKERKDAEDALVMARNFMNSIFGSSET